MWSLSAADTAKGMLLHLFQRADDNQSALFSPRENLIQKAFAVSASVASIALCVSAIYMFVAIDPKRLVFRHQLIAFLIFFDLLKAVVLLIFPARVMANGASYASNEFCQVVGFFTATATEGADLAILAFAVHTFLLIFKPSLNVKVQGSGRVEGGLYKSRYFVYGLSFLIPLALASFPYIGLGYQSFVCWCYLPQHPYWYRAALSWVPRYVIVVVILVVYLSIYIHVLREFRLLGGAFSQLHRQKLRGVQSAGSNAKPSFFSALMFFLADVRAYVFPQSTSKSSGTHGTPSGLSSSSSNSHPEISSDEHKIDSPGGPLDMENSVGDAHFHAANLESFQKRQRTIEKQMKSIFIYPLAYISIWLFPFILHCTQITFEEHHGPVVWLNYLGAFMQPFIGFVDSLVFFYREQPWKYTIMRNFEKENEGKLDLVLAPDGSTADSESTTTSARYEKSSLALSMRVDLTKYSRFRRFMSKCRLPFMKLPSEENIAKFQADYFRHKMNALRRATAIEGGIEEEAAKDIEGLQAKHDFSNLLNSNTSISDYRPRLDSFSFGPQEGSRKASLHSGNVSTGDRRPSMATISNKSAKSRRVSVFEGQDPIPEHGTYRKSTSKASKNRGGQSISVDDDEEMDFMDFLGRGP